VQLVPGPVQRPRIPVWIGGDSKPAYRRAARWDGWVIGTIDEQMNITLTPVQVGERAAAIRRHRTSDAPFAVAVTGATAPGRPRAAASLRRRWRNVVVRVSLRQPGHARRDAKKWRGLRREHCHPPR
jgi:alkanesulfonate monooxygenase SsuD/methylene tetrahydromethanopterin reductase-like flavin-dependent oxidoreductase (luciferase family)